MELLLYFIAITIIFLLAIIYYKLTDTNRNNNKNNIINEYVLKKQFMTSSELYFYHILKELENELDIVIHPQTNLATIINKKNSIYRSELFRNIDFAIFSKDYAKLLLLIEINDKTHNRNDRIKRDEKVKSICNSANIKLIKFYTNMPNKKDYVKNRIKEYINNI